MTSLFVSHDGMANQIDRAYATNSLFIIFIVIALVIIFSFKKKDEQDFDDDFLDIDTGLMLKGIAILILLFGHLAIKCIDGTYFFEYAGVWSVVIFLYISGIALTKTYGIIGLNSKFLIKRIVRLAIPTWVSLFVFFILDFLLTRENYKLKKVIFNFLLILDPSRPNGPAWFITYILFLYILYFLISKINTTPIFKIIFLYLGSYIFTLFIWRINFLSSHFGIWTQYTFVFPSAVMIGFYRKQVLLGLSKIVKHKFLYYILISICTYQYFSQKGVYRISTLINSWTYSQVVHTVEHASLLLLLVLASFLMDRAVFYSRFLKWFGVYSFEIFLIHFPLMVSYDFFLFRKPLYLFFFAYLFVVVVLSLLLNRVSSIINSMFFVKAVS